MIYFVLFLNLFFPSLLLFLLYKYIVSHIYFYNYLDDIFKYFLNIKKIYIIIPIFNKRIFLDECLNSVINQSLNNIEIICIDDGTTDNSSTILYNFTKYDDRFVIIDKKTKEQDFQETKELILVKENLFLSWIQTINIIIIFLYNFYKKMQKDIKQLYVKEELRY